MRVFSVFSRLLGSVDDLAVAVTNLVVVQSEIAPATARLDALELERHKFEARMEGLLLQAEGKHKAAMNAEARERQLKKSYERLAEEFDAEGLPRPEAETLLTVDAESGQTERVHELPLVLAPNNKALAIRAKWA